MVRHLKPPAASNPSVLWDRQALLAQPMLEPLHHLICRFAEQHFPGLDDYNALLAEYPLVTQSARPLRFVEQAHGRLAFEAQYEPRCYLTGEVQTRTDNWHDLFNALVWFAFPRAKAAINARHYFSLTHVRNGADDESHSQRGTVRDTNTLLDESGVIVPYADDELAALLRHFRWHDLFWSRRAEVQSKMGFYLFGHGLHEKALKPYLGFTGQGLLLKVEADFFGWSMTRRLAHLDQLVGTYLSDPEHCRSTRELTPVPLLGVPGWAADNEHVSYYDNKSYFRDKRSVAG